MSEPEEKNDKTWEKNNINEAEDQKQSESPEKHYSHKSSKYSHTQPYYFYLIKILKFIL